MHVMNDSPRPRPFPGAISTLISTALLLALTAPAAGQCAVQRLGPPSPAEDDRFGTGLAIVGDTALIGATGDDHYGTNIGAVYVYEYDGEEWIGRGMLPEPSVLDIGLFGIAIAVDGNRAIVAAAEDEPELYSHSAFVYKFDGENWYEEAHLPASSVGANGFRITRWVAIDDDVACVGSRFDDHNGQNSGAAYVYRYDADSAEWIEEQMLLPDDGDEWYDFGASVAATKDMLLIGAPHHDGNGVYAGAVYVFRYDTNLGQWYQETRLVPGDVDEHDQFGTSIAISGERVVIGAPGVEHNGYDTGAAWVYLYEDGQWQGEALLMVDDEHLGGGLGFSCAIQDDLIVAGAFWADGFEQDTGVVHIFHDDGTSWIYTGRFENAGGVYNENLGNAVAIGGQGALASAWRAMGPFDDCGAVFGLTFSGDDCNRNTTCDWLDLAQGVSEDCNNNQIPDECDVTSEFRSNSGPMSPIGHDWPQTYTVVSPPLASESDVRLTFSASANLGGSDRFIDIYVNYSYLDAIFVSGGYNCLHPPQTERLFLPQAVFNEMIGGGEDLIIEMIASEEVDPEACDGQSYIAVEVFYYAYGPGDANHNGIPDECECPADLDGDADVDTSDLLILLGAWGTADGDVDFDGDTDTADLLALLGAWGECPEEKAERGKAES